MSRIHPEFADSGPWDGSAAADALLRQEPHEDEDEDEEEDDPDDEGDNDDEGDDGYSE